MKVRFEMLDKASDRVISHVVRIVEAVPREGDFISMNPDGNYEGDVPRVTSVIWTPAAFEVAVVRFR